MSSILRHRRQEGNDTTRNENYTDYVNIVNNGVPLTLLAGNNKEADDDDDDDDDDDVDAVDSSLTTTETSPRRWLRTRTVRRKLLQYAFLGILIVWLVRWYLLLERHIRDPAWRGLMYGPLSFAMIRYWQSAPTKVPPRELVTTRDNTFVIHLDSDTERLAQFQKNNPGLEYQIFPATYPDPSISYQLKKKRHTQWLRNQPVTIHSWENNSSSVDFWRENYPSVQYFLSTGRRGTAGVSISHLRLWERLAYPSPDQDDLGDYLFVFEDDAQLSDNLLNTNQVFAPVDVDVVFLMASVFKTVPVGDDEKILFTRVFGGFGTWGYVITKAAARIALDRMRYNQQEPIDIAMMDLAVYSLRLYLPIDHWPAVRHAVGVASTKLQKDK